MVNRFSDGKLTNKSEFEAALHRTIITAIQDGGFYLDEMALLWLYCRSWGPHADHVLSQNGFWKFNRDHLRQILFDFCFPDPDENQKQSELVQLLTTRLDKSGTVVSQRLTLFRYA